MQDATQIIRCWTVLVNLTGVELLIQLWPVMLQIARLVAGFRRRTPSPEGMFQFETKLQDLLREVGRLIVQWTVNHLEPGDDLLRQKMPFTYLDNYLEAPALDELERRLPTVKALLDSCLNK